MKVSINWAQQHSNVDLKSITTDQILHKIGSQLGAVEAVEYLGPRFDSIVVVRIVSCHKHPDADKLSVCFIDDGGVAQNVERDHNGHVQVVCGAPNVKEGLLVAWLPPGSTVPSSFDKDPFVLGARELRGVMSNGMLASSHELGINDDHTGILEIKEDVSPGTPFKYLYGLDDVVIDCENKMFTHRPDCFGILGVARELAGICGQKFVSPEWYTNSVETPSSENPTLFISTHNDIPDKVPRFTAQVVENVSIGPSDTTIQTMLMRVGIKSINSVVDLTNYYMHLTAQPTHAFDYDKVKALSGSNDSVEIFPRMAKDGETLELLGGKTITLNENDIVIATSTQAIALAGVMGGAVTEVDASTKNIIVECANFDMFTIRRTSMRHGLFTDAVTRFNKGQSAAQIPAVLTKLVSHITDVTGSTAGMVVDEYKDRENSLSTVTVSTSFISERLGSDLTTEHIANLLRNVEFDVSITDQEIHINVPFWRKDIEIAEDIVEEIGRLNGYDTLPVELPLRTMKPAPKNELIELKKSVRSFLAEAGANEVLSYSFVSSKLLQAIGQDETQAYQLSNALSPALEYYRLTLTPSLLSKVNQNIRAGYDSFVLFEMSKTHIKMHGVDEDTLPKELPMLALVYAANAKNSTDSGAAYYTARAYADYLARSLHTEFEYKAIESDPGYEVTKPYDWKRSAYVSDRETGTFLGIIGEYTNAAKKNFKLPKYSAGFEIDYNELLKVKASRVNYKSLSRYPGSTQDITFKTALSTPFTSLYTSLSNALKSSAKDQGYETAVTPLGVYAKQDSNDKHISFRVNVRHQGRTLTTDEVNKLRDQVVSEVQSTTDAVRI
jgi:phenylalanyl-tRNA synthetase beta chain